jgi:putative ABC transport system ATP-binding protein
MHREATARAGGWRCPGHGYKKRSLPMPDGARAQAMNGPLISCRDLGRELPSGATRLRILDGVSFEVEAGEFVAILGPSGSGKSTLLALIAGLDRPSSGSVRLDGRALEMLDEDGLALLRRRLVGFVFQSFHLLENLTARENVLVPLELIGAKGARARADEYLRAVGLEGRGHHYPAQLSGGEQQRVALARAFAPRPRLLLADEPTGNLDRETGLQVLGLLRALREQEGTTLVLVTHDPGIAASAERLLHLSGGRLVRDERRLEAPAGVRE